jgi:hypothetical protein
MPYLSQDEIPTVSCLDTIIKQNKSFSKTFIFQAATKNVKEIDSTKGFVKYSMKFSEDFHKIKPKKVEHFFLIEPILTNYATTRFLPGISVGIKTGYNWYPSLENSKSYGHNAFAL